MVEHVLCAQCCAEVRRAAHSLASSATPKGRRAPLHTCGRGGAKW